MTEVTTVLWDLDGTLCVPRRDRDAVLEEAFDRAGIEPYCTIADLDAAVEDVPTAESELEFYELLFGTVAERVGVSDPAAPTMAESFAAVVYHSDVTFREGAAAAVRQTRERYRIGLVTNGSEENQRTKLRTLGIEDAFAATAFADPAGGIDPKPATDGFELVLDELGADPSTTVHVGDSLESDVAGAHAAGIDSVWVPTDEPVAAHEREHEPTHVLEGLDELPSVL